jgi:hypothetical protein
MEYKGKRKMKYLCAKKGRREGLRKTIRERRKEVRINRERRKEKGKGREKYEGKEGFKEREYEGRAEAKD